MDRNEIIGMCFIGLGVTLFLCCWFRAVYCWLRGAPLLSELKARLKNLDPDSAIDFLDFFQFSDVGFSTKAQEKIINAVYGKSFSELDDLEALRRKTRKYYRGFFRAIIAGFITFGVFFGFPIILKTLLHH